MSPTAAERVINDPDNHYPYKKSAAIKAGWPAPLAEASERVVKAQAAYLKDPSDENLQERNDAEKNAQQVKREQAPAIQRYHLEQQLNDLDAGNQPAHVAWTEGQ
jgi:hypothetical protein